MSMGGRLKAFTVWSLVSGLTVNSLLESETPKDRV